MTARILRVTAALAATLAASSASAADPTPKMVEAFAAQLIAGCGASGPAAAAAAQTLVLRADLNGDQQAEWIVDANRYPCPNRSSAAAAAGPLISVFAASGPGRATPVFQQPGYGASLSRGADGGQVLTVKVGGADCGVADVAARCDRRVRWDPAGKRYGLAAR